MKKIQDASNKPNELLKNFESELIESCPYLEKMILDSHNKDVLENLYKQRAYYENVDKDSLIKITLEPDCFSLSNNYDISVKDCQVSELIKLEGPKLMNIIKNVSKQLKPKMESALTSGFYQTNLKSAIDERLDSHNDAESNCELMMEKKTEKVNILSDLIEEKIEIERKVFVEDDKKYKLDIEINKLEAELGYWRNKEILENSKKIKNLRNEKVDKFVKKQVFDSLEKEKQMNDALKAAQTRANFVSKKIDVEKQKSFKEKEDLDYKIKELEKIKKDLVDKGKKLKNELLDTKKHNHSAENLSDMISDRKMTFVNRKQMTDILEEITQSTSAKISDYKNKQKSLILLTKGLNDSLFSSEKILENKESQSLSLESKSLTASALKTLANQDFKTKKDSLSLSLSLKNISQIQKKLNHLPKTLENSINHLNLLSEKLLSEAKQVEDHSETLEFKTKFYCND